MFALVTPHFTPSSNILVSSLLLYHSPFIAYVCSGTSRFSNVKLNSVYSSKSAMNILAYIDAEGSLGLNPSKLFLCPRKYAENRHCMDNMFS